MILYESMRSLLHLPDSCARPVQTPGTSVHWYGKQVQNKRKLGHITITGTDNEEAHQRLHSIDAAAAAAMKATSQRYTEATAGMQHTSQTQGVAN